MKKLLYAVIFLVIFVVGLTFAARNPQVVHITYYFGVDIELPLAVLLLGSLVAGVVIGYLASLAGGYRRHRRRLRGTNNPGGASTGSSIATRSA